MTSVMGQIEEQQKTTEFVNNNNENDSNCECDACGGAISGVGGVEDC